MTGSLFYRQAGALHTSRLSGASRSGGASHPFAPPSGAGPYYLAAAEATTPGSNSDGTPNIVLGTGLLFAAAGEVRGIRWYTYSGYTGSVEVGLWQITSTNGNSGTLLGSATVAANSYPAHTWITSPFSSPIPVAVNTAYIATIYNSDGWYTADVGFCSTSHGAKTVDDPVYSWADNEVMTGIGSYLGPFRNGRFAIGAGHVFPTSSAGAAFYGVDVEFFLDA